MRDYTYLKDSDGITITGYSGPGGAVTIPDTIDGLPITSIGSYAFFLCTSLTSITIPNSVVSIGQEAFAGTSLTSITIPDSVTDVGYAAFRNCTGLTGVTIPDSVTDIGARAFEGCDNLTNVTIPKRLKRIARKAFPPGARIVTC